VTVALSVFDSWMMCDFGKVKAEVGTVRTLGGYCLFNQDHFLVGKPGVRSARAMDVSFAVYRNWFGRLGSSTE